MQIRRLPFFAILLVVVTSAFSNQPLVQTSGMPLRKEVEKAVTSTFLPPKHNRIGDYDSFSIENCSYLMKPEEPILPIRRLTVKLPEGSNNIIMEVKTEETMLQGNYTILPAQMPTIVGATEETGFTKNPTVYASDQPFPSEWFSFTQSRGYDPATKGYSLYVVLSLFPLRFIPTENKVIWTESISIRISYIEIALAEAPSPSSTLSNLIVTSPALQSYANQLASWKNMTQVPSKVLTTTWIYSNYVGADNPEKIRNCIRSHFTDYGIEYVTIFGDADQVPVRYAYVPDGQDEYVATDLYYAALSGTWDDNHDGVYADQRHDNVNAIPEVYVGRISVSTAQSAQTVVDKIKEYQQRFDISQNWTRKIILAAGTGSSNGLTNQNPSGNSILKNYIADVMIDREVVKLYESSGNLTATNLRTEINGGALFTNFAGHGNPESYLLYWVNPGPSARSFGISDVQTLTNGYKLPVVTTMSCSTARFDDKTSIGEWFLREPDGGSIAYFGSTRIAWGYVKDWSPFGLMGEMDRRIYEKFNEGFTRTGQMWGEDMREYVLAHMPDYNSAWVYDAKTVMEFILLGDPTLNVGQTWDNEPVESSLPYFNAQFASNDVRVVYPSDSSTKPLGCGAASVSDWLASMAISTKLTNYTEGLDTDSDFVNQTSGKPLGLPGTGIVSFGGPFVNPLVKYAESDSTPSGDRAPVRFYGDLTNGSYSFKHWDGSSIPEATLPSSVINHGEDMFVVEVYTDGDGRYMLLSYGFGWKGTYAAGKYFHTVIYRQLGSFDANWVIVRWEDSNGDGFVNNPGDGDSYSVVASGKGMERTVYVENASDKYQSASSWIEASDVSSWSGTPMKTSSSSTNNDCLYGPYITTEFNGTSMLGKPYNVSFLLKILSNSSANNVAYVDVCCNLGEVLASRLIRGTDFAAPDSWQSFELSFTVPSSLSSGLEFRVINQNNGITDVYADQIQIRQ